METPEYPMLEAAEAYVARGFRVIPLYRTTRLRCTCENPDTCGSRGKHPIRNNWQKAPQAGEPARKAWWGKEFPLNIGIATGPDSNLLVLDVDGQKGEASLGELVDKYGALPKTLTRKTGSGGWHFYFEYPDFEVGNSAGKLGKGLDTRGKGGFVVAPPSVSAIESKKGAGDWREGHYSEVPSRGEDVVPAPDWLLDLLRPKERQAVSTPDATVSISSPVLDPAEARRLAGYTEGAVANEVRRLRALHPEVWDGNPWNNTVFEVAANLIQLELAEWNDYAASYADVMQNAPRDPGFGNDVINRTYDSAKRKVEGQPAAYPPKPADILDHFAPTEINAPALTQPNQAVSLALAEAAAESASLQVAEVKDIAVDEQSEDDVFKSNVELGTMEQVPETVVVDLDYVLEDMPIEPETMTLDPNYVARQLAIQLGIAYSSAVEHEVDEAASFEPPLDALIDRPDTLEDDDEVMAALEPWLETHLLSGSPDLFWRCLRTILEGTATDAPVIVFKGGHEILGALVETLHPAIGDEPEMLLFGPRVSTREVDEPMVVLAFDDEGCPPVAGRGLVLLSRAEDAPVGPLTAPDAPEAGNVHLPDYRAAQLERTRLGMARIRREGETHASQDAS